MELIVETSLLDDVKLKEDITEAQETAEEAYSTATKAVSIAGNNDQYFWHSQTGADTGAHITLVSQETFKANPRGANVLIRNNGIAMRDALKEVAVFTSSGVYFNGYVNNTWQQIGAYTPTYAQIGSTDTGRYNIKIDASSTVGNNGMYICKGTINLAKYTGDGMTLYDESTHKAISIMSNTGLTLRNSSGYTTFSSGNSGMKIFKGVASPNNYELLTVDNTGMTLRNDNNQTMAEYGSYGTTIYAYTYGTVRNEIAKIYSGSGNSGAGSSTSIIAPYYTFGLRKNNSAIGNYSVVLGNENVGAGYTSLCTGEYNVNYGEASFCSGYNNEITDIQIQHVEESGRNLVVGGGFASHSLGLFTVANQAFQTVIGIANIKDTDTTHYDSDPISSIFSVSRGKYAFIIGNGSYRFPLRTETELQEVYRSNAMTVSWTGATWIAGSLTQNSDRRLKQHIDYLDSDAVEFIRKLKPVHFIKDKEHHVGFYAQDVEQIDKWHCMVGQEDGGYKTLGYIEIIAPLVKYCQYLEQRIAMLEGR